MLDILSLCIITTYTYFIVFIILGLFKHKVLPVSSSKELPVVSVVIAARNEEKNLPDILRDLIRQEYPIEKLEVIIVNDRSGDSTSEILDDASRNYLFIKALNVESKSKVMTPKKYALQLGIERAKGEIIILTDADCRVNKLWVSSMVYGVLERDSIIIGFSKISTDGNTWFEHYQKIDFLSIIAANAGAAGWNRFWSGTGQNLAFYKDDFFLINGFDPVKDELSGDDMYLVQSISKIKNAYLHIDPNSFVKTSSMPRIKDFINQRIRWSSNAKKSLQSIPEFFLFLLIIFSYNSHLMLSLLFGGSWILLLLLKLFLEGLVLFLGGRLFNTNINMRGFLIWSLIQPFYIPIIGILGIRGKFSWKP